MIDAKEVRIVTLDLPTSWSLTAPADEFTAHMFAAVNAMMLDILAAVARKDYEDRRRRRAEGTAKAKATELYKGRPANKARNAAISSPAERRAQLAGDHGCDRMQPHLAGKDCSRSPAAQS